MRGLIEKQLFLMKILYKQILSYKRINSLLLVYHIDMY